MNSNTLSATALFELNDQLAETRSYQDIPKTVLDPLAQLLGAETALFATMRKSNNSIQANNFISIGIDHRCTESYQSQFQNNDPVLPHAFNSTQLKHLNIRSKAFTFTLDNIVDQRSFSKGEYYNGFLRPNSIRQIMALGVPSKNDNSLVYIFGFHRYCNRPFQQQDALHSSFAGPALYSLLSELETKTQLQDQRFINHFLGSQKTETGLAVLNSEFQVMFANLSGQNHLNIKQQRGTCYLPIQEELKLKLKAALQGLDVFDNKQLRTAGLNSFELTYGQTGIRMSVKHCEVNKEPRIVLNTSRAKHNNLDNLLLEKYQLTKRESGLAVLVAQGLTNPQISEQLNISIRTVENHLRSIYSKVGVHNRTSLAFELTH